MTHHAPRLLLSGRVLQHQTNAHTNHENASKNRGIHGKKLKVSKHLESYCYGRIDTLTETIKATHRQTYLNIYIYIHIYIDYIYI